VILLDTNVLSEPLRTHPDADVVAWLAKQTDVAISAISVGELLVGVAALPDGNRRRLLAERVEDVLTAHRGRILPYGVEAARVYAGMNERRRRIGMPLSAADGMIAAIAAVQGAGVATRNVRDFAELGVDIVDPWSTGG
jgi:hypothetical protein